MKITLTILSILCLLTTSYAQDEDFTSKYILTKMKETEGHKIVVPSSSYYQFADFKFSREQPFYYEIKYRKVSISGSSSTVWQIFKPALVVSMDIVIQPNSSIGYLNLRFAGKTALHKTEYDSTLDPWSASLDSCSIPFLASDQSNGEKLKKALERLIQIYKEIEKADPFAN